MVSISEPALVEHQKSPERISIPAGSGSRRASAASGFAFAFYDVPRTSPVDLLSVIWLVRATADSEKSSFFAAFLISAELAAR
jgi:hypothetical protein